MTSVRLIGRFEPRQTLDVDFTIGPGVTALYGSAGAGKTYLLETIAGFQRPDSGRVLLDDAILFDGAAHVNTPPRKRRVGFVAQADALFPHMTVRRNLAFAARPWPRLERHRRVQEMMDRFSLAASAKMWPRQLDPATKRRCAIARALIAEPKLLLLDDFGADETILRQVRDATTSPIVFATDNLDLSCAVADQLLVMDAGRILQSGAPRTVIDQPATLEAARLMGAENLFEATIAALDPGRNSSRLEFEHFVLTGPYIPGHFKGNRVWVAIAAEALRLHPSDSAAPPNSVAVDLVRASDRAHSVLMEFNFGIRASVSHADYESGRDNKAWQVEFPFQSLRIL
jgi:molybdate transport system ATP-binding protein